MMPTRTLLPRPGRQRRRAAARPRPLLENRVVSSSRKRMPASVSRTPESSARIVKCQGRPRSRAHDGLTLDTPHAERAGRARKAHLLGRCQHIAQRPHIEGKSVRRPAYRAFPEWRVHSVHRQCAPSSRVATRLWLAPPFKLGWYGAASWCRQLRRARQRGSEAGKRDREIDLLAATVCSRLCLQRGASAHRGHGACLNLNGINRIAALIWRVKLTNHEMKSAQLAPNLAIESHT